MIIVIRLVLLTLALVELPVIVHGWIQSYPPSLLLPYYGTAISRIEEHCHPSHQHPCRRCRPPLSMVYDESNTDMESLVASFSLSQLLKELQDHKIRYSATATRRELEQLLRQHYGLLSQSNATANGDSVTVNNHATIQSKKLPMQEESSFQASSSSPFHPHPPPPRRPIRELLQELDRLGRELLSVPDLKIALSD